MRPDWPEERVRRVRDRVRKGARKSERGRVKGIMGRELWFKLDFLLCHWTYLTLSNRS